MAELQQLELIYQEYESRLADAASKAGLFAGAFNMGDDPRKDACNQIFYEKLEQWTDAFLAAAPTPEDAAQACDRILFYPVRNRQSATYWMAFAAQKCALALIPLLSSGDAADLRREFLAQFPREERMPVQRQVLQALSERAGGENDKGKPLRNRLQNLLSRKNRNK